MNAAERIRLAGLRDRAVYATRRAWRYAAGLLALLLIIGINAERRGERRGRAAMAAEARTILAESSKVIEARLAARAPAIVHQATAAARERVLYRDAAAHVQIVHDTTLRIDSVLVNIPAPVVQVLARCDSVATTDSLAIHVQAAQLEDLTKDRDNWRARALADESQEPPAPPRFGFMAGFLTGVTAIVVPIVAAVILIH